MEVKKGMILSIVQNRGFGYIKQKESDNLIFFHAKGVCDPQYEDLREGQEVEFMTVETPKGNKAIGIVVI